MSFGKGKNFFVLFGFLLFLGLPEEATGIRMEATKPRENRGGTSSFLQQRQGNGAEEEVARTTALTAATSNDLAALMQRMTVILGTVKALDAKVTSLQQDASKVELQIGFTGTNLAKSMGSLAKIETDSSANRKVAVGLQNSSKLLAAKSVSEGVRMDALMKQINTLEMNAEMMGKGSTDLGAKITKLETTVSEQLPGVGNIGKKLDKAEADIKNFDTLLKKGIEAQVGVELKEALGKVRGEVRGLADELEKRKLKENE